MRNALQLGALALLTACGHGGAGLSTSVHTARQALHAVPLVASDLTDEWAANSDARVSYCRAQELETPEARAKCMGPFGAVDDFEAEARAFQAAYDAASLALEQLEAASADIEKRVSGAMQ